MTDPCAFQPMFPLAKDDTNYRKLTDKHVETVSVSGEEFLRVGPEGIALLSYHAFADAAHLLRPAYLAQLSDIIKDPGASDNDRYVALEMLQNARISSEFVFPLCQDTGTAVVFAKKGDHVYTGGEDSAPISEGVRRAYTVHNLRYSQNAPLSTYKERNTGCNLPADITISATPGNAYEFLFIAKGGGSANKTYLFQMTKALLNPSTLLNFLVEKMVELGTAACPPYHLAFVIGGTSAEMNLKTVKLATAGYLDGLPGHGSEAGQAFRDNELEYKLLKASQELGIGAQFGGKYFCLDVRVVRLPRHGASCPVGLGVSCSAHRNVKGKITAKGIFLEELERDPGKYLPKDAPPLAPAKAIDLNRPMDEIRAELSTLAVGSRIMLNGPIVVARDIAHARLKERLDSGQGLPDYFRDHIIYYAGPAKTPPGYACGSCGPTTSGRMDPYVPIFQRLGASLVMLGKGNRSELVTRSCQQHGGFYLGAIGGPADRLGKECITEFTVLEFPELHMEAIAKIVVKDFPAFVIVDDKGHDFFANLAGRFEVLKSTRFLDTL